MSFVLFFRLHFSVALSLNPLALILGKEGPFSPEITPSLCAINLSTLSLPPGFEDTGPAPGAPLPITCHLLVQIHQLLPWRPASNHHGALLLHRAGKAKGAASCAQREPAQQGPHLDSDQPGLAPPTPLSFPWVGSLLTS